MAQEHAVAGSDVSNQNVDPAAIKEIETEDQSMMDDVGARVPYKSFRKKYQKMNVKFQEVMKQSDALHAREIASQRLFNHLLREKNRLVDILNELNKSNRLDSSLHVNLSDLPELEGNELETVDNLSEDCKHYLSLIENAFEYSSDEESAPRQKNPMGLLEWLKQNQPQVFTESIEKAVKEEKPLSVKKRKTEGGNKEQKKDPNAKRIKTDEPASASQSASESNLLEISADSQNSLPSLGQNVSNAAAVLPTSTPTGLPLTSVVQPAPSTGTVGAPSMYNNVPSSSHGISTGPPLVNSMPVNGSPSLAAAHAAPSSLPSTGALPVNIPASTPGSAQLPIGAPSSASFPSIPPPQIYSSPSIGNSVQSSNLSAYPAVSSLTPAHSHTLPSLPSSLSQSTVHPIQSGQAYPVPQMRHDNGREILGNLAAHSSIIHQPPISQQQPQPPQQPPHQPILQPPHQQLPHQHPPSDPFTHPL